MFYILPEDFEGCKSNVRIDLENNRYSPFSYETIEGPLIHFVNSEWPFDTKENRDKALKIIDNLVRAKSCMQDVKNLKDYLFNNEED